MPPLFYISKNELYVINNGQTHTLFCQAIDQYKKNLHAISKRKEWKTKGSGAQFMGMATDNDAVDYDAIMPMDMVVTPNQTMIYCARLQEGTAIYTKPLNDLQQGVESLILRKTDFIVYDMNYDNTHNRLVLSAAEPYDIERHLCLLSVDNCQIKYITEGECQDANPIFDPQNSDIIYYDSCGYGQNSQGSIITSPKEICSLNLKSGEINVLANHPEFDYLKPYKDNQGNLYYLKRPYKNKRPASSIIQDILLSPIKIIKAIIGWLDFFTQRYTGESLKTSGANPAKNKQKTLEELFIEGNLIKANQAMKQNIQAGEKFAGFIPSSWQLIKQTPNGETIVIKKGVLSYALQNNSLIYSNGKHLVQLELNPPENSRPQETLLADSPLITKVVF